MVKIKIIKDTEKCKVGEIVKTSKKSAESYVDEGYAEYVEELPKIEKSKAKDPKEKIKSTTPPKIILTEEQINSTIKEISKLEMPLEINKKIRKLSKDSELSLQTLQKQLNYEKKENKKGISNSGDTNVTNVTNVIYPWVTLVTRNKAIWDSLFSDKTLDRIMKFLAEGDRAFTYDEIAKRLGLPVTTIKMTISRNQELFGRKYPNGKICYAFCYAPCVALIQQKIKDYEENLLKIKERELEQNTIQTKSQKIVQEFKNFYKLHKKELGNSFRQGNNVLYLDFIKLSEFDLFLIDELTLNPEETLKLFELAIEDLGLIKNPRVRVINLPKDLNLNIEELRSKHLNELISLSGRIITLSDVRPQCVNAKFECPSCGTVISVLQIEKKFREPSRCSCGRKGGFKLIDKEMIETARLILEDLQEKTDNPHAKRLNCFLKEDLLSYELMSLYNPGGEVEMVGILKEVPVPLKEGGISTRFEQAFEINSIISSKEEIEVDKLSKEEIDKIKKLSKVIDEEGLEKITSSFCPSIYGYDEVKKALVLQLAAQRNKIGKKSEITKPNILLIGDPGTSKTILGEFSVTITPGARKSVGGSASAVGFTGAVVRDDFSGGWRLEPGAIVLTKDLFMLDELNNIKDEDKPRLQEALSEHTITVDKATIHTKLSAPSCCLATANPIHGIFKENEDLVTQFNLNPAIINRFDIIFVVKDIVNEAKDFKIAKKMNDREMKKLSFDYSEDLLTKFFIYVKEQPEPQMTEEISDRMAAIYSRLRRYKTDSLNINPRVHKAFQLFCKASARIRLSEYIEEKDIERSLEILSESYFKTPSYIHFKIEKKVNTPTNKNIKIKSIVSTKIVVLKDGEPFNLTLESGEIYKKEEFGDDAEQTIEILKNDGKVEEV